VADALNRDLSRPGNVGPFWCSPHPQLYPHIPQQMPAAPFTTIHNTSLRDKRTCDGHVDADWPFRLFGQGSVGSQLLVGIPRLHQLRYADRFRNVSRIWPFETGWAPLAEPWLTHPIRIVHAEIYPSVIPPLEDNVRDRGQVRAMWTWARDADRAGQLQARFAIPDGIQHGSPDDLTIRQVEGWILH
jgi:precorrin-8X/cobalt-precorrin-8 methylmutase